MSESPLMIQSKAFALEVIRAWLELLYKTNHITESEYKALDSACTSIRVTLISSINTAKENAK